MKTIVTLGPLISELNKLCPDPKSGDGITEKLSFHPHEYSSTRKFTHFSFDGKDWWMEVTDSETPS